MCLHLMRAGLPAYNFLEDRGCSGDPGKRTGWHLPRRKCLLQTVWMERESGKAVHPHSKLRKCDTMQGWGSTQAGVGR